MNHVCTQKVYNIEYNPTIVALPSELCWTVECDLQWIIFFSTEVGERRLHSNPVGTPNLVWIGWKLQKLSLQNFQLIPLSPWVPTFHTQQGGSHVALYRGRYCPKESNPAALMHWVVSMVVVYSTVYSGADQSNVERVFMPGAPRRLNGYPGS